MVMNFRLRFTGIIFILFAVVYLSIILLFRPIHPVKVLTKFLYEPGHDIINPSLCLEDGRRIKVLIAVMSAPGNRRQRTSIRKAWGKDTYQDFTLAFFVGKSLRTDENILTSEESLVYSDIIRGNNVDSYRNLTLKTISFLEWTDKYCSNVRFILKTDDDVFVNVENLLKFVEDKRDYKETIFGELARGLRPLWWPLKWYVSSSEYGKAKYPDFLFGPAYLLTSDTVHWLYQRSLWTTFFKLEDVFITGIVAQSMNFKRTHSPLFVRYGHSEEIANSETDIYEEAKRRISIHGVEPELQMEIWDKIRPK